MLLVSFPPFALSVRNESSILKDGVRGSKDLVFIVAIHVMNNR